MWVLFLNDMRSSNVENLQPVCKAETKEQLIAFIEREKVEGYRDGQWGKGFRQGGMLEWFNSPWDDRESFRYVGSKSEWMEQAAVNWEYQVGILINV